MIVEADWGIGGNVSSSAVAREGILDNEMVGTGGTASPLPIAPSAARDIRDAPNDVRVGDTGSGGTSAKDDTGGRWDAKDARDKENDARRLARDDFFPSVFAGLTTFSSVSESSS